MRHISIEILVVLVLACGAHAPAQDGGGPPGGPPQGETADVSVASLITELADLSALPDAPRLPFALRQVTSRDGVVRAEKKGGRTEHVLMEAKGAGAVVRLWTDKLVGRWRVYVDGSPMPVIDMEAVLAFTGQITIFAAPFSGAAGGGWSIRFPIPYAKSIKVTCDAAGFDWHVVHRTYAERVKVESFLMKQAVIATYMTGEAVGGMRRAPLVRGLVGPDEANGVDVVTIGAGKRRVVFGKRVEAPEAITSFSVEQLATVPLEAWRALRLEIAFDGVTTVRAPLDAFFGGAAGSETTDGYAVSVGKAIGFVRACRFVMPYRETVEIAVRNAGATAVSGLAVRVESAARPWTKSTRHLHAAHRAWAAPPPREGHLEIAELTGPGRHVGDVVTELRSTPTSGAGALRLLVDGAEEPTHAGTTLAADFGTTAEGRIPFSTPFEARMQAVELGSARVETLCRWRHLDGVAFDGSLRMELAPRGEAKEPWAMGWTVFWYGPGGLPEWARNEASWSWLVDMTSSRKSDDGK